MKGRFRRAGRVVVALGFLVVAAAVILGILIGLRGDDMLGWGMLFAFLLGAAGLGLALLGVLVQTADDADRRVATAARIALAAIIAGGLGKSLSVLVRSGDPWPSRLARGGIDALLGVFTLWGGDPLALALAIAAGALVAWRSRLRRA